jgi:hypothetical protein
MLALSIISGCISEKELFWEIKFTKGSVPQNISSTYVNKYFGGPHYSNLSDLLLGFYKVKFYENQRPELDSLHTRIRWQ